MLVVMVRMVVGPVTGELSCLPSVDFTEQMLLSFPEKFISELPSVWNYLPESLKQQKEGRMATRISFTLQQNGHYHGAKHVKSF